MLPLLVIYVCIVKELRMHLLMHLHSLYSQLCFRYCTRYTVINNILSINNSDWSFSLSELLIPIASSGCREIRVNSLHPRSLKGELLVGVTPRIRDKMTAHQKPREFCSVSQVLLFSCAPYLPMDFDGCAFVLFISCGTDAVLKAFILKQIFNYEIFISCIFWLVV